MRKERKEKEALLAPFVRMDSDTNGNPRYYVASYHVPEDRAGLIVRKLGLTRYRGKRNGAGYVLQSYNVETDARELARLLALSEYEAQGETFLLDAGATLSIEKAVPQKAPAWAKGEAPRWARGEEHGIKYSVTITTKRGAYTFPFWDSVHAKEKGETPTAYSVLACLDYDNSADFADFCDNYGYDTDSISALQTYEAVREQSKEIARIFTSKQLRALAEIA